MFRKVFSPLFFFQARAEFIGNNLLVEIKVFLVKFCGEFFSWTTDAQWSLLLPKSQIFQTWFFKLDFSNLIFQTWFFKLDFSKFKCRSIGGLTGPNEHVVHCIIRNSSKLNLYTKTLVKTGGYCHFLLVFRSFVCLALWQKSPMFV